MRTLVALAALGLAACRPTSCDQVQCLLGQTCAYKEGAPDCFNPCLGADAGTCLEGGSCSCAASCPACTDCLPVCNRRLPL